MKVITIWREVSKSNLILSNWQKKNPNKQTINKKVTFFHLCFNDCSNYTNYNRKRTSFSCKCSKTICWKISSKRLEGIAKNWGLTTEILWLCSTLANIFHIYWSIRNYNNNKCMHIHCIITGMWRSLIITSKIDISCQLPGDLTSCPILLASKTTFGREIVTGCWIQAGIISPEQQEIIEIYHMTLFSHLSWTMKIALFTVGLEMEWLGAYISLTLANQHLWTLYLTKCYILIT